MNGADSSKKTRHKIKQYRMYKKQKSTTRNVLDEKDYGKPDEPKSHLTMTDQIKSNKRLFIMKNC